MNLLGGALELLFWVILVGGFVWYATYAGKKRYETGTLAGKSGAPYTYVIGDRLHYGYTEGVFSGIDIVLPASLPNIYLDGKQGDSGRGPRHYYLQNPSLQLEGDFDRYFDCYAIPGYQALTLSILTPDVMQTLIEEVPDCDVEIRLDHLRIIVDHKLYQRPEMMAALQRAAEAVLAQVDEKLQSWTDEDSRQAAAALLSVQEVSMHKLFGRNYRLSTLVLGPIYGVCGLVVWWAALATTLPVRHVTLSWLLRSFWLPFLFFPCLWLAMLYVVPTAGFRKFMDVLAKLANWIPER